MLTAEEGYKYIADHIIPQTVQHFLDKTNDYRGGPAFLLLGSKGQFSDINRKFWKLYASIWEGQELEGEQPWEIVEDFVGHCFLMLLCLAVESQSKDQPSQMTPEEAELLFSAIRRRG